MTVKERAIALVQAMPDDVSWEEAAERLRIMAAIEVAEADVAAGRIVSQADAEARIQACLQKLSGHQAA